MGIIINELITLLEKEDMITLVDVGSMGGVSSIWNPIKNKLQVIGFEPDDREFGKLTQSENEKYLNYALYSNSQEVDVYITKGHGKTSLLKPDNSLIDQFPYSVDYEIEKNIKIPASKVKTLDDFVINEKLFCPDILKLDTQGTELEILKGANQSLSNHLLCCLIEVEFVKLYENQALFSDVDKFMTSAGFELFDLKRYFWKKKGVDNFQGKGQLIMGDALYFKTFNNLSKFYENDIMKLIKFIIILSMFGYYDHAMYVLNKIQPFSNGNADLYQKISSIILSNLDIDASSVKFPGSTRIFKWSKNLKNKLNTSYLEFADADEHIGNVLDG